VVEELTRLKALYQGFGYRELARIIHYTCNERGIHLRRDSWVSVRYAEGLNATTSSVTLQRTDRQGIVGQKPTYGPMSL
jgi:flagellar basal body rod protein FlgF